MLNINLLCESVLNPQLASYAQLKKHIRSAGQAYKNAIKSHEANDSQAFMQHSALHRHHETAIHSLLSNPDFLSGSHHIQARHENSKLYLADLMKRKI